ncbi:hypothetical protein ACFRAO_02095 [Streptomyces sp. NPDC056656]|uniref:hypothetical protein n=1 Tax=Streptomyces sp. NPDC056656 TaxID=3345895 RepID=UPI0036A94671
MRSLPLPLALTVRVLPVAVLACAGWAWTSGPMADSSRQPVAAPHPSTKRAAQSASAEIRAYDKPPEPCSAVTAKTVAELVPKADPAGKELAAADRSLRRGCSWSALKDYDYRWLDVSFEIKESAAAADTAFTARGKGDTAPGLADEARIAVALTTHDKQNTREAVVTARAGNALVTVTYNGSDFESHGAPATDGIYKGALKAAGDAVAKLTGKNTS